MAIAHAYGNRVVGPPLAKDTYTIAAPRASHRKSAGPSIDVQILRLRPKLQADPSAPHIIRTERGVGYVYPLPVAPF